MAKKLSKEELEALALSGEYFKGYPKEDTLLATQDGNFFLEKDKVKANEHARKAGGKVFEIEKSIIEEKAEEPASDEETTSEEIPSKNANKAELVAWLTAQEIEFDPEATNKELYALIENSIEE